MPESLFKGYWMVTNRCNLDCGYCVLEDAPHQLRRELDLAGKKALVSHLYRRLGFRRLTLSGGEVLLIGGKPPSDFVELLRFLRGFRSTNPRENLEVELYTNGVLLDDRVAGEMEGVVDQVAVTIDSADDGLLTTLGRNHGRARGYFGRAVEVCARLTRHGIDVKLHSVVGRANVVRLGDEVAPILDAIEARGGRISKWKFYQYMSYDDALRDGAHKVPPDLYTQEMSRVERALAERGVALHFKDDAEMNASLFNILSYGNAQYMRAGDTWSTSRRTRDLRTYETMAELFASHDLEESSFRKFHEVQR
jgi:molybdenum cofactor biosynthesis enzyme MoaA